MLVNHIYRAEKKSLQILLSRNQAGPGRKVKQEQEEISRNHVLRLFLASVLESVGGRRGKCFERGKGGRIPKTLANYSRLGSTARGRAREGWRNTKGGREWAIK